jgi:hypothetical protein
MYGKQDMLYSMARKRFDDAVRESVFNHVQAVLERVPPIKLDTVGCDEVEAMLIGHVSRDVMPIGLVIMCPHGVYNAVRDRVSGMIAEQRRRMNA